MSSPIQSSADIGGFWKRKIPYPLGYCAKPELKADLAAAIEPWCITGLCKSKLCRDTMCLGLEEETGRAISREPNFILIKIIGNGSDKPERTTLV